ncbi:MAG TPA: FecR domain-containing protein, partial [Rariglobus sp.]
MRLSTLFAILGLALVMTLGLPAQTVRVIFVSGQASLQRPDEASLRPAVKGETVIIGTRIVTGADGRLVLTPMPGVKSIITPNTTILLESSAETRTSDTNVTHQAVIELKEGAVVSDLQKPEGVTYDYSIRTARGLAGARGTTFTVGINAAGIQTVVVAHGVISINFTDGRQATLALGHLSITRSTGDTQSVANVGELPEADQKIAKNWTEITLTALADALENGIEVDPAALNNALDAAKSLGIIPSPEVQAAVDRALATVKKDETLFHREETADPLKTVIADNNNKDEKPQDIISPPPAEPPVEPPPPEPPPPEPTPV